MKIFISLLLIFNLVIPAALAGEKVFKYTVPPVKNAFCGVDISYQYCKCAFHNQFCEDVGLTPGTAHTYVLQEFQAWNKERIQKVGESCIDKNGYWNKSKWSCTTCTQGDILDGKKCVEPDEVSEESRQSEAEAKECKDALQNFDKEWEKYSDFDDRLGGDVSYEVQQFNKLMVDIGDLSALAQDVQVELVVNAAVRTEMIAYKAALVTNIRNNITKAIFRLAWVTYNTVQSARGSKGTIEKLLDPNSVTQAAGATMKLIQAHIPKGAKGFQIDTSSTSGKVASIAWNATLETIESVGDPSAIVQQGMKDIKAAIVPGPDMTEEEVAILRTQHLSNKKVDQSIADNWAETAELRTVLLKTRKLIAEKYNEAQEWKVKEYQRVKFNIEDQCKDEK